MPSSPERMWRPGLCLLIAFAALLLSVPGSASAQDQETGDQETGDQAADARATLSPEQQGIVSISALTARGDLEQLQGALGSGLDAGLTVSEIKEVLVHLYAYCGFPRSLQGLSTFMAVLEDRAARGIEDEVGEAASLQIDSGDRYAEGERVLATLAGWPQTAPLSGYSAFSPVIEQFLKEHLFADLFGRDVLSYAEREIATISALAGMDGVEPMLESHMGLGLRVGLTEAQLRQLLSVVESTAGEDESTAGEDRAEASREVLSRVVASQAERENGAPNGAQDAGEGANENRSALQARATVFPRGRRVESENFTGPVWVEMLVTEAETFDTRAGNVTFEPGSRTNWHAHPGGQLLLATGGAGYHQERGEPVQLLRKGDVVKVAPGVEHWHGATPESEFTHVAVATNDSEGETVWLDPVTDEEYHSTW